MPKKLNQSTLERVRAMQHVAFVDDERSIGNSIIVTLRDGYDFRADPGCGVMGFDTVREVAHGCAANKVILKSAI